MCLTALDLTAPNTNLGYEPCYGSNATTQLFQLDQTVAYDYDYKVVYEYYGVEVTFPGHEWVIGEERNLEIGFEYEGKNASLLGTDRVPKRG